MATPAPRCPECSYSLAGEVARWESSCPLEGRCPECGLDFHYREAIGAGQRSRWLYDIPSVRGPAPRRWWAMLARIFWPPAFWREAANQPLAPRRLVWWLAAMLVQFHVLNLGLTLLHRWFNVQQWRRSTPLINGTVVGAASEWPFWPENLDGRMELLASPWYDASESSIQGPHAVYGLDFMRTSMTVGTAAVGILLLAWAVFAPGGVRRAMVLRAVAYGFTIVAIMYIIWLVHSGIFLLLERGPFSPAALQWWIGTPNPSTGEWRPGGSIWVRRTCDILSIAWFIAWWWRAGAEIQCRRRRWVQALVVCIPVAVATAVFIHRMNFWNRWMTL